MIGRKKKTAARRHEPSRGLSADKLDRMIEEATVDAYGESEQTVAFFTMLEDNLKVPFQTQMLGVEITVERIDLSDGEQIVAVCRRGKWRQRVSILDLPLPSPSPEGAVWIEAFRRWARGSKIFGRQSEIERHDGEAVER